MTRREFSLLLLGALNEQSRALVRRLYARGHRGERDRGGKLAPPPTVATRKTPKVPRK